MIADIINWFPFGAVIYTMMFSIVIFPLLLFGYKSVRWGRNFIEKLIGVVSIFTPFVGAWFYSILDYFDNRGKYSLWWIIIVLIHLVPLALSIFVAFKTRKRTRAHSG